MRPAVINNGGDPTGIVDEVAWASWGGRVADGWGVGFYVPPTQSVAGSFREPVKIRAYDLTMCGGHPAYRHVIWWFPSKGETYQSAQAQHYENYNLCAGS